MEEVGRAFLRQSNAHGQQQRQDANSHRDHSHRLPGRIEADRFVVRHFDRRFVVTAHVTY